MLTPLELNGKTFSRGFRGYDTEEVDTFMAQLKKDYERLYQENTELKDTVERVSSKLEYYQHMEGTMQSTLVVAQETADEVKKSSEQRAEVMAREMEVECKRKKEETQIFCKQLKDKAEEEAKKVRESAKNSAEEHRKDAADYALKLRTEADSYSVKAKTEADAYAKSVREQADSYVAGVKQETGEANTKLINDTKAFVDKMKSMAEIEAAKLKVEADDIYKTKVADAREQSNTLTTEANKKANDLMNEATKKAHEMVSEATERSHKLMYNASQKCQKMVFEAEARASAAMDVYKDLMNKSTSHRNHVISVLESQLAVYKGYKAEDAEEEKRMEMQMVAEGEKTVIPEKAEERADALNKNMPWKKEEFEYSVVPGRQEKIQGKSEQNVDTVENGPVYRASEKPILLKQDIEQSEKKADAEGKAETTGK